MKILLSNDDGIHALGLKILHNLLKELGHQIYVCAPHRQHSGSSHSITLSTPLLVHKIYHNNDFFGIAVDGSPSDAVKLGLSQFYPEVEMVVSGINLGPNAGPSVYYSGTVAAAFEGAMQHKISLAFSFESFYEKDMNTVEEKLRPFMPQILSVCQQKMLYNINIPYTPIIQGIKVTRQFRGFFGDEYEKRTNPLGHEYFWLKDITYTQENSSVPAEYKQYNHDVEVLKQGYISLSPLQFDLTNYHQLVSLQHDIDKK